LARRSGGRPTAVCVPSLGDQATPKADRDGVGAASRLQLREQMANVRLHGLLGEEQLLADLAIGEPVPDEPENLDLTRRRRLTDLAEGCERDDFAVAARPTPCGDLLELARVVLIPAQNLLALGSVHGSRIGGRETTL
jgi:hypothetical protein